MLAVCDASIIFFIYTKEKRTAKLSSFLLTVEKAANMTLKDLSLVGLGFYQRRGVRLK